MPARPPILITGRQPKRGSRSPNHASPDWLRHDLETRAMEHAAIHLVPQHLDELRHRKEEMIDKTKAAVQDRLTKEINYWDHRAATLKDQELAGKVNAKLNSGWPGNGPTNFLAGCKSGLPNLSRSENSPRLPPVVLGGAMIVPIGLLRKLAGRSSRAPPDFAIDTERIGSDWRCTPSWRPKSDWVSCPAT